MFADATIRTYNSLACCHPAIARPARISRLILIDSAPISATKFFPNPFPTSRTMNNLSAIASRSSSTGPKAKRPTSSVGSPTKSSAASRGTRTAANSAADRTLTKSVPSPHDDAPPLTAQEQGRSRFKNAFEIDLDRIEPNPNQPRKAFDPEKLAETRKSMHEIGLLHPIVVRWNDERERYQIVAGECRFRSATDLGWKTIPCWIKDLDDWETQLAALAENWTRMELRPMELAQALGALRDGGMSQADIARRTGKSAGEISKLLKLLTSHPDVQRLAEQDPAALTKHHLYRLADAPLDRQPELAQQVMNERLTVDQTETLVREKRMAVGEPTRRRATYVRRFTTSRGTVTFIGTPDHVSDDDVLTAVNEVRQQLAGT